jgi:hypothetical protein
MPHTGIPTPGLVPILSAGKHRTAKQGACFMEFASYLAGERWSDHPACTDPTLAALSRGVNDTVSDSARARLSAFIPSVIGLRSDSDGLGVLVAVRAGIAALPVASETRQFTLAAGLLHASELLAEIDGDLVRLLEPDIRSALSSAPHAHRWARAFRSSPLSRRHQLDLGTMTTVMVATSVIGIAEACINDPDDRLIAMLVDAIEASTAYLSPAPATAARAEAVLA